MIKTPEGGMIEFRLGDTVLTPDGEKYSFHSMCSEYFYLGYTPEGWDSHKVKQADCILVDRPFQIGDEVLVKAVGGVAWGLVVLADKENILKNEFDIKNLPLLSEIYHKQLTWRGNEHE